MLIASSASVRAQLPQIRLHSIFPAGGQTGTSVDVVVTGGADLDDIHALLLSNPKIIATPKMSEQNGEKTAVANTFTVTIPSDVQPGVCDVRVAGRFGVSNPRSFEVTARQEVLEAEPNDTLDNATPIALNCVVNGRMNTSADVDMYRFQGRRNQRVLVDCRAARLDSRLLGDTGGLRRTRPPTRARTKAPHSNAVPRAWTPSWI